MFKKIGTFLLAYLIVFSTLPLHAMELDTPEGKQEETYEQSAPSPVSEQEQQTAAKKKKKKKKKKKSKEELACIDPDTFDVNALINKDDKPEVNLARLQLFANFLLFHAEVYNFLQEFRATIKELEKYQDLSDFHVKTQIILALVVKKFDERYTVIDTPEKAAVLLQLIQLRNTYKGITAENLPIIDNLLQNDNEEVATIAKVAKAIFLYFNFENNVKKFLVFILRKKDEQKINFTCNAIDFLFGRIQEQSVVKQEIRDLVIQFPHFNEMYDAIARIFLLWKELESVDEFHFPIKDMVAQKESVDALCSKFQKYADQYKNLYTITKRLIRSLISKQKGKIREFGKYNTKLNKIFLNTKVTIQSSLNSGHPGKEKLNSIATEDTLPKEIFYNEYKDLSELYTTSQKQKEPAEKKNAQRPRKKKRAQGKKHTKETHTLEQKKEEIEQPKQAHAHNYDPRVERWFNDAFTYKCSPQAVLYHSFSRKADGYIFSLGVETNWQNQTKLNQIDKRYSLSGEIEYDNGNRVVAVFTCTKDPNGICYHRGIDFKEKSDLFKEYFKENHWNVHLLDENVFSAISEEQADTLKEHDDNIELDNDLCVKIRDNRLKVRITLDKLLAGNK